MMSFELYRLLKFNKNLYFIYILILLSPEKIKSDKLHYYPLAQQSCGGDIGSVPYVCTYVRSFVRSFTFCHLSSDLIYYSISI